MWYFYLAFLKEPQDRVVVVGTENITLPCQASTTVVNGSLHIVWQHNGTWISDFNKKHYTQLTDGSMFFIKFLPFDIGRYVCTAIVFVQNKKIEQLNKTAILQAACK